MAEAYIRGLERRLEDGKSVDIHSVASFFVSRVDTEVDKRLEGAGHDDLLGKAGIANARAAYQRFKEIFLGERFAALRDAGAAVQRPLWASTGVKNPAYPRRHVRRRSSSAPNTVNTMPMATLLAAGDHAEIRGATARRGPGRGPRGAGRRRHRHGGRHRPAAARRRREVRRADGQAARGHRAPSARRSSPQRPPSIDASLPDDDVEPRVAARVKRRSGGGRRPAHLAQGRHALGRPPASPRWPTASGWLDVTEQMREELDDLQAFAEEVRDDGRHGRACCWAWAARRWRPRSSAAPSASRPAGRRLHVLDSTDAGAVRGVEQGIDLDHDAVPRLDEVRRDDRDAVAVQALLVAATGRAGASSPSPTRAPAWRSWRPSTASGAPSSTTPTSAGATARCRTSGSCPRRSWAPTWRASCTAAGVAEQNCAELRVGRRVNAGCGSGSRGASWPRQAATS